MIVALVKVICAHCGNECQKESGHVNRSRKNGSPLFCSRDCSGARRRLNRSDDEKKALKAESVVEVLGMVASQPELIPDDYADAECGLWCAGEAA